MLSNEQWEKLDMLVRKGAPELAVPQIVEEIKTQLTTEQLKPLGNLQDSFNKIFSSPPKVTVRVFVENFIDMAQKGVIDNGSR